MQKGLPLSQQLSERSVHLRAILKKHLEQKKITYAALAKSIGVSLPTVKRWLTKDDLPVEGLDAILNVLNLTWRELIQALEVHEIHRQMASEAHENFLVTQCKEGFVFILLFHNYTFAEVQALLGLSTVELETIMLKLDRHGFIAYKSPTDFRPLLRGPFRFSNQGKFSQRYFIPAAKMIFEKIVSANTGFSPAFQPSNPLVRIGEMYLSPKSMARFKADLWEIIEKYHETARIEASFKGRDEIFPVTFLLTLDKFPLWQKLMWGE